jgi:MSHA biogenesis protein MshN
VSLVNDMLNDLDDRRLKRANEDVNLDWMTGQRVNQKNRTFLPILWIILILVLLFVAYKLWQMSSDDELSSLDYLATKVAEQEAVTSEVKVNDNSSVNIVDNPAVIDAGQAGIDRKVSLKQQEQLEVIENNSVTTSDVSPVAVDYKADKLTAQPEEQPLPNKSLLNTVERTPIPVPKEVVPPAQKQFVKSKRILSVDQADKQNVKDVEQLIRLGQIKAAENKLQGYLDGHPKAIHSGSLLVSIFLSTKSYIKAEQLIEKLRLIDHENIGLISNQARVYLQTNRASEAVELLMSSKPNLQNNTAFYELLGLAARQNNQFQLSLQAYRGLLDIDSSRGDWWVGMAIALDQKGEVSQAKKAYRQGVNSNNVTTTLKHYAQQRLAVL